MNDWSNDALVPGDLIHIWRSEAPPVLGIVLSLNKPPTGSLQIYDAQVLIGGQIVNVYRQNIYRITARS